MDPQAGPSGVTEAGGTSVTEAGGPSSSSADRKLILETPFVEDVEEFLAGREADGVIKELQDRLQQYKLIEMKLLAKRRDLQGKIPDIKKCQEIVAALERKSEADEETRVDFEVAEKIFTQAVIKKPQSVCLWLGANVMLEYSFKEAKDLLEQNLTNATASLEAIVNDLHFLRDQITTTEVTSARVYNHDVQMRRRRKLMEASKEES